MSVIVNYSASRVYQYKANISNCRFQHITKEFKHRYGQEVEFFARSPGRVNLIGKFFCFGVVQSDALTPM